MEFQNVIFNRRSIRTFLDEKVSDEQIYRLLEFGHAAPSAGNIQPWEFIIVKDEDNKKAIVETTFIGNNMIDGKPQEWILKAPVIIVVVANKQKSYERYGKIALETLIYLDCSACIENMLLGAVELGLASCYVSGFRKDELSKVLKLPETHEPIAILPIGYSNDVSLKRPKVKLDEIIHCEVFSG